MKKIFSIFIAIVVIGVFWLYGKSKLSNDFIRSYGWKGGGCGMPDVFDFRNNHMQLNNDIISLNNKQVGVITLRVYRYADSFITVKSYKTGETCTYWAKWKNKD